MSGRSTGFGWGSLGRTALLLCASLALLKMDCGAAENANYTYKVTFYPGNHGSFQDAGQVTVEEAASQDPAGGASPKVEMAADGSAIVVTGLEAGDRVRCDAAVEGAVRLEQGSRYYVKGIRASGRDNNTVSSAAFPVGEDMDYVVAYGIKGEQVKYVVNYVDTAGDALAPSDTYWGNVGDKPRVAYRYIEGYQPQTYNLTKTLSKNDAENVFTFIYRRIPAGASTPNPGQEDAATPTTPEQNGNAQNQKGANQNGQAQNPGGQEGNQDGDAQNPGGQDGDAQNQDSQDGNQDGEAQNPGGQDGNQGGDVQGAGQESNGPSEEVDLDNQDMPLADFDGDEEAMGGAEEFQFPIWASVCIAVAGVAAVAAALWIMLVGKKKAKAKDDKRNGKGI